MTQKEFDDTRWYQGIKVEFEENTYLVEAVDFERGYIDIERGTVHFSHCKLIQD